MEFTLISLLWLFSAGVVLLFHLIIFHYKKIPDSVKSLYVFGKRKTIDKLDSKTLIPVPKSWFTHFYGFGLATHSVVLAILCLHLTQKVNFLYGMEGFWRILQWPSTHVKDRNASSVMLVFVVEWIQMARRLYECLFVSSFSKSSMSPLHYVYGVFYYCSFGLGLLASTDVLNLAFSPVNADVVFYLPAVFLFFGASYFQHRSMQTFASLRQVENGKPAKGHFIPKGHLFQWVSCPHYLCEMVIYFSLCLIFRMRNEFLNSLLVFVVFNQISSALMSHDWYLKSFKNYPKDRKAVIPYIL